MSRNSRIWQDSLAHATIYEGDTAECSKWIGWAKQKLQFMLHSRAGSSMEEFYPSEGVRIRVDTRPNRIMIASGVGSMYMESGFLLLGTTAMCNRLTFLPAHLEFKDKVAGYISSSPTPLECKAKIGASVDLVDSPYEGTLIEEGYTSKALVGSLSKTVTDLCGNVYASATADYGNQTTWQCKYAQRYVPASLYSGKLRLYVQAVYGSTSQDYSVVPLTLSPDAKTYDLVLKGYRLNQGIATSGIFTTADYVYYMMECNVNSVTFKKLKISGTARGWLDILKTHPNRTDREFSSKVEAYVLSTAIIDPDFTPVVSSTGLSVSEGGPYAYGFHFNWSGNQAKVIWVRSNGDNTYSNSIITLDIADDLTVSGSQTSEKSWSNGTYFQFWYPDSYDGVMKTQGVPVGGSVSSDACPMYGYFDYDDVWQEFDISCSIASVSPYDTDTGPITDAELTGYGMDTVFHTRERKINTSGTNAGVIGYSFNGGSDSGTVELIQTHSIWSDPSIYLIGGSTNWGNPFSTINNNGPLTRSNGYLMPHYRTAYPRGTYTAGWGEWAFGPNSHNLGSLTGTVNPGTAWTMPRIMNNGYAGLTMIYTVKTNHQYHCEVMMAVPFGDCESVIFGIFKSDYWDTNGTGSSGIGGRTLNALYAQDVHRQGGTYPNSYTQTYGDTYDLKQSLYTGVVPTYNYGGTLTVAHGPGSNSSVVVEFSTGSLAGWTNEIVDGYVVSSDIGSDTVPSGWAQKYFRNNDGISDLHPAMLAKASVNGAHILYHDEGTGKNENGYPDGVYSSVGWS